MIKIDNISAGYNNTVVSEINMQIEDGTLVAICGPNGCGKTTLLKAIMNTGVKVSGRCLYNDNDILTMNPKTRAGIVSFLPQILETAEGISVKDVLEMAFYKDIKWPGHISYSMSMKTSKVAELTGITELLGREYCRLSQGQKQLVLWTRLLLQDTKVVLLDEPDSALDFTNRHIMLDRIRALIKKTGKTGIVVLHDPGYALNYCDGIFLMKQGQLQGYIDVNKDSLDEMNAKLDIIYPQVKVERTTSGYAVWPDKKESIDAND